MNSSLGSFAALLHSASQCWAGVGTWWSSTSRCGNLGFCQVVTALPSRLSQTCDAGDWVMRLSTLWWVLSTQHEAEWWWWCCFPQIRVHCHGGAGPTAHGLSLPEHQPLCGEFPQDGGQAAWVGETQSADPRHQLGKEVQGALEGGHGGESGQNLWVSFVMIQTYLFSDF